MVSNLNKTISVLFLIIFSLFSVFTFTQVGGAPEAVTATFTNLDGATIIQYNNSATNISDISSVLLKISQGGNFKSFQTAGSWVGKKTAADTISFTSTVPIKPGESTKLIVKTDQQNPVFTWEAYDDKNNKLGSGNSMTPEQSTVQNKTNQTQIPKPNQTTVPNTVSIFDVSKFRISPSSPQNDSDIRVIGQSFGANANLDLYIGNNKIDSFVTDRNGNFIITSKVPPDQPAGGVNFIIKDQGGSQKTFTTVISDVSSRNLPKNIMLTLNTPQVLHRGDNQTFSGTAKPGATITLTIQDSTNKTLTSFTTKADKTTNYSISRIISVDQPFGAYTVTASDGTKTKYQSYKITTTHTILVTTSKKQYNPGETVVINGTATANQGVEFMINDPTKNQIFAKGITVSAAGNFTLSYQLGNAAVTGTYILTATQGNDEVTLVFGVGEPPVPVLTANMDKIAYVNTDKPIIRISGPLSTTLNLVVVDPAGAQKLSALVPLGSDGFATYSFSVSNFTAGLYAAVLTSGNDKAVANFAVGLQSGTGSITMTTVKQYYVPGDNVIIFGKSNSNSIILLKLIDPNGNIIKSQEVFSDKNGILSSTAFIIPSDGVAGTWKLDATSGLNHSSLDLIIHSPNQGISIQLDKNPPVYAVGDIMKISGRGAGSSLNIKVNILDSNSTIIVPLQITSTITGEYSTLWNIPKNFAIGTYITQVFSSGYGKANMTFTVQ